MSEKTKVVQVDLGDGKTIGVEVDDKPRNVIDVGGILFEVNDDKKPSNS